MPVFPNAAAIIRGGRRDTFACGEIYYAGPAGGGVLTYTPESDSPELGRGKRHGRGSRCVISVPDRVPTA